MYNLNATNYYIDYENGSDTNDGLSSSSAWQHCPGMQTGSGTVAAYVPQAGDAFIFKGGVTWQFSGNDPMFPIEATGWESGTADAPISFTVDKSWFNGSEWSRPIFDGGADNNNDGIFDGDTSANIFFNLWNQDFFVINNFELLHHEVRGYGHGAISYYKSDYSKVLNCLIHDWVATVEFDHKYGGIIFNDCENALVDTLV